jgi:NTP pyrophosphatase (non-canonical NTP hydrolase)
MNKEFKIGCTYSDNRGNKWLITGHDTSGDYLLLAQCENYKGVMTDLPIYYDSFLKDGRYLADEYSNCDLIWQDQSEYTLTEFKRKINLFNEISGKSGVPSDQDLHNQVRLITEEAKEIKDALEQGEPEINLLQEALDVLVVTFGLIEQLKAKGYNVDAAMGKVVDCNLSKFTQDEMDVINSTDDYSSRGITVVPMYNKEHQVWVLKDEKNKIRKPLSFKKVNLEDCKPK